MTTAYQEELESFSVEDWVTVRRNGVFTECRVLDFAPKETVQCEWARFMQDETIHGMQEGVNSDINLAPLVDDTEDLNALRESLAGPGRDIDFAKVQEELDL
jgi:hypothetical protein